MKTIECAERKIYNIYVTEQEGWNFLKILRLFSKLENECWKMEVKLFLKLRNNLRWHHKVLGKVTFASLSG